MKEDLRALIVLPQLPMEEGSAGGRVAVGMMRGLQQHGIEVRALAAQHGWEPIVTIPPDLKVDVVAVLPRRVRATRRYIDQVTKPMSEMRRGAFDLMLRTLAKDADVVHLVEADSFYGAEGIEAPTLAHLYCLVRRDRPLGFPWQKSTRWGVESLLAERWGVRHHQYLVANSQAVAAEMRRLAPDAEVVVVPLTLEPEAYARAPLDGPPIAGLIGTATWPPTERAVRRVITDVWPLVKQRVPDATLRIAGRNLPADLVSDPSMGVEICGEVGSAVEFLCGLSVLLYPLSFGSGMKVKVLESIACGLPVVTTPDGAEGIEADGGIVVETTDERIAASTAAILTDTDERHQRGEASFRSFERRYTPVPATAPLADLYRRMRRD